MRTEIYGIEAGRRHQDRPRGLPRPQSKIAPPTAPAAPVANLQQKLAERLYCALAPAMDTSGRATEPPSPTADGAESHSKTSAPPLSAMAAHPALRSVRSMPCEEGNFTIGIIA